MVTPDAAGSRVAAGYLVPAEVCVLLARAARAGVAQLRRDGVWAGDFVVDAVIVGLADLGREHCASPDRAARGPVRAVPGPSALTSPAPGALSTHDLDTTQAAALLGVAPQQARRLAARLGGVRDGRDWRIPRRNVVAERDRRAARR